MSSLMALLFPPSSYRISAAGAPSVGFDRLGARLVATRVLPGTSSFVYEKPLEAVLSGPQLRFAAIQLPTPLVCERQLAFDVVDEAPSGWVEALHHAPAWTGL